MERTEDLLRIVEDSRCAGSNVGYPTTDESGNTVMGKPALKPSEYLNLAQRVASNIESNDALVSRMDTLSARKEFSNDPTVEMAEISDLFHMKVAIVQRDFETLKRMTEDGHHVVRSVKYSQSYLVSVKYVNRDASGEKYVKSSATEVNNQKPIASCFL
jgi:regulator of replication initiation timing